MTMKVCKDCRNLEMEPYGHRIKFRIPEETLMKSRISRKIAELNPARKRVNGSRAMSGLMFLLCIVSDQI